jgi:hypothetical protein
MIIIENIDKLKAGSINQYSFCQEINSNTLESVLALHLEGKASMETNHPGDLFKQNKFKYGYCFGNF